MSRVRYYTDEHVSKAIIRGLRVRGVDVLSVPEANMLGASDETHLAFALAEGRVIFTQDADLFRLAATGHEHAGIAYARQGTSVGHIVQGLVLIVQALAADLKSKPSPTNRIFPYPKRVLWPLLR